MELVYRGDADLFANKSETFAVRFLTSYLGENSIQSQGGILDDRAGQIGGFGFPEEDHHEPDVQHRKLLDVPAGSLDW